jgi:hypothetical protein
MTTLDDLIRQKMELKAGNPLLRRPADGTTPLPRDGASAPVDWQDVYPWPELREETLYGLAGDFVRLVAPQSETALSALIAQFVVIFGAAAGPNATMQVESTIHHPRTSVVLVGATAFSRKGTSLDHCKRVFRIADEEWAKNNFITGLASGEGLIARLADFPETQRSVVITDPEFGRTLTAAQRDGSILSHVLREMYDSGHLESNTRKSPMRIDGVHAALVGHITAEEYRAKLATLEIANGSANRLPPICVKRRQRLAEGGSLSDSDLAGIAKRVNPALTFARQPRRMRRSDEARALWKSWYDAVPDEGGLLGAMTARAEAHVLRLSMIYALLDCSETIEIVHLLAAIAFWDYAVASARYIFGRTLGDKIADRILDELRLVHPGWRTRDQLRDLFSRHEPADRLRVALESLERQGLAARTVVKTAGRPEERWVAVPPPARKAR